MGIAHYLEQIFQNKRVYGFFFFTYFVLFFTNLLEKVILCPEIHPLICGKEITFEATHTPHCVSRCISAV